MDRAILAAIIEKFDGGPVGIETLAAAVGEERDTIEDVYEPYLLQEGFIARTPRGRVATRAPTAPRPHPPRHAALKSDRRRAARRVRPFKIMASTRSYPVEG